MDVGAMKGPDKKGDKGKKGYGKSKYGKSFGEFGAKSEYGNGNEHGKSHDKGKDKGKKGKGKGPDKEEKLAPHSSFASHYRSCGRWGHWASECWQGYVQGAEGASEVFLKFDGEECGDHDGGCEDGSCHSRGR